MRCRCDRAAAVPDRLAPMGFVEHIPVGSDRRLLLVLWWAEVPAMRWASLFMVVALILAGAVLVRGAAAFDGLSLLALVFVILSFLAWLFSWLVTRAVERGRS